MKIPKDGFRVNPVEKNLNNPNREKRGEERVEEAKGDSFKTTGSREEKIAALRKELEAAKSRRASLELLH